MLCVFLGCKSFSHKNPQQNLNVLSLFQPWLCYYVGHFNQEGRCSNWWVETSPWFVDWVFLKSYVLKCLCNIGWMSWWVVNTIHIPIESHWNCMIMYVISCYCANCCSIFISLFMVESHCSLIFLCFWWSLPIYVHLYVL